MRPLSLLLLFSALSAPLFSQDHAPTASRCLADAKLWQSEVSDTQTRYDEWLDTPSFRQLVQRSLEMHQCYRVDNANAEVYDVESAHYDIEEKGVCNCSSSATIFC